MVLDQGKEVNGASTVVRILTYAQETETVVVIDDQIMGMNGVLPKMATTCLIAQCHDKMEGRLHEDQMTAILVNHCRTMTTCRLDLRTVQPSRIAEKDLREHHIVTTGGRHSIEMMTDVLHHAMAEVAMSIPTYPHTRARDQMIGSHHQGETGTANNLLGDMTETAIGTGDEIKDLVPLQMRMRKLSGARHGLLEDRNGSALGWDGACGVGEVVEANIRFFWMR